MPQVCDQSVLDLAARLGISVTSRDAAKTNGWDGKSIARRYRTNLRSFQDMCHEIAHWIVCAPDRRSLRDFGLGTGPDGGKRAKLAVPSEEADAEECRASLLGVAVEYALGLDGSGTLDAHSWTWNYERDEGVGFWTAVVQLREMGLLDSNGRFVEDAVR